MNKPNLQFNKLINITYKILMIVIKLLKKFNKKMTTNKNLKNLNLIQTKSLMRKTQIKCLSNLNLKRKDHKLK